MTFCQCDDDALVIPCTCSSNTYRKNVNSRRPLKLDANMLPVFFLTICSSVAVPFCHESRLQASSFKPRPDVPDQLSDKISRIHRNAADPRLGHRDVLMFFLRARNKTCRMWIGPSQNHMMTFGHPRLPMLKKDP